MKQKTKTNQDSNLDPGFWIALIMLIALLAFCAVSCNAQTKQTAVYDTIFCKTECIQKYVEKKTAKSSRVYAVYVDKQHGVAELIPVSKSVFNYIATCKEYQVKPNLGIRLKNGQIYSIVKLKTKIQCRL